MKNRICTLVSKPLTGPLASLKNKPKKNTRLQNGLGHYSVTGLANIPKRYNKKKKKRQIKTKVKKGINTSRASLSPASIQRRKEKAGTGSRLQNQSLFSHLNSSASSKTFVQVFWLQRFCFSLYSVIQLIAAFPLILSMEAQRLLSGFCSTPPIQNTKTQVFVKFPLSSSSASFAQSQKWVSFKACPSISQSALSGKVFQCRNSRERIEFLASDKEDLRSGIRRKKLAVFVSGGGSNFRSIQEACLRGSIHGDIVVVVTSKQDCGGADYARDKGLPVILFPKTKLEADGISPADLVATLRRFEVDFVLLAGYLKLIPAELIQAYPRSILNIHPSLLPAFGGKGNYGMKVHKAVIASGSRYTGPTIHFVDEHYDTGRILAQRVVPVLAKDTAEELAARVLREEHRIYVEVITALCEDRVIWREDGVPIIRSKENPNEYS